MLWDARHGSWDGQLGLGEYQTGGKTHLLIEVCARLGVGDLGFQEGACAHLDVHHTRVVEVIQ